MGRKIGLAKEHNGLYFLSTSSQPKLVKSILSTSFFSSSNKDVLWLHHRRLGHVSFSTLKLMFPTLFKDWIFNLFIATFIDKKKKPFHCDICEYAKHTRVSFPIINKISSSPFFLIHSDIWGPSTILNISGSRWFVTFIDDCSRVSWIYLLKINLMRFIFSLFFVQWFKINLVQKSRKSAQTMLVIIQSKFVSVVSKGRNHT